jgi:hypothetical protein
MRRLIFVVLCGLVPAVALADFRPTQAPTSPDGGATALDLPTSQHMRNVGGSDGSGLCVFTSITHAARWGNVRELDGYREWMQRRPGGGWPQKVDDTLAAFCREKGVPVPPYIQHTGGDEDFLKAALKTGRMVCVTYDGRDDFYRGRIAHMVNLAYLDDTRAAIIDNNRPGYWVWMTRAEFLSRWRGGGGGWAVVLLSPPPPPHVAAGLLGCDCCKPECKCEAGKRDPDCVCYPCKCGIPQQVFGQCSGGSCSGGRCLIRPAAPLALPAAPALGAEPVGNPPGPGYVWDQIPGVGYGWVFRPGLAAQQPAADAAVPNYGIDPAKIHAGRRYCLNGCEVSREEAMSAVGGGLVDDSDHWHVTAVGDAVFLARVKTDVATLPDAARGKLLFQGYAPDHWAVSLFTLSPGVTLRKPAGPGRKSSDVGAVATADYTPAKLADLMCCPGGPTPKPAPQPTPQPGPAPIPPAPIPPVVPLDPAPVPTPTIPAWLLVAAGILFLLFRKGK